MSQQQPSVWTQRYYPRDDGVAFDRVIFFSDAVYAIAITLLVIDLRLPAGAAELDSAALARTLWSMWPQLLSYMLSFLVIGTFWSNHHRKFRYINRFDGRLMWINLLLLMVIAFIPFPTAVIGESGNATATILYAGTIVAASLLTVLLWWYAQARGLIRADASPHTRRMGWIAPLSIAVVFGLSIPLAFYDADWAKYFWLLLVPISLWLH